MSKRKREVDNELESVTPNTSLQNNPLSFLIPKQFVIPFSVPYDVNISSDTLLFSQDDFNEKSEKMLPPDLLNLDIWKTEDPDLKFVKFKKPLTQYTHSNNQSNNSNDEVSSFLDKFHLENIKPVTKDDYFKQNLKSKKIELFTSLTDETLLIDKINKMVSLDEVPPPDEKLSDSENNNSGDLIKPEFIYETKMTQNVLISHIKEEFITTVQKLFENLNSVLTMNESSEFYDQYTEIFPTTVNIVRSDTLHSLKAQLIDLVAVKSYTQIDQEIFSSLLDVCINIIEESSSIDWEVVFTSEDIFNTPEYETFAETIMISVSIVIILYSNDLVKKINKHQNCILLAIHFICDFGSVLKLLYTQENFTEVPDFFIPTIKHYISTVSTLYNNIKSLSLDESLVTRLEYISFELIFVDILSSREIHNLNVALEEMRANFAYLVVAIYSKYEDQRIFIFTEIIDNFSTLNPLKSKSRNYRADCGITVQLISFLVVSLIQCHNEYGKDFDYSKYDFLELNHSTKAKKLELKEIVENYWESIRYQLESMEKAVNSFVISFLKKIIVSYTPTLRKIVENMLSDFILMIDMTEFPACSIILNSLLKHLLNICHTLDNTQSSSQSLFFEIIGTIGSKILSLKNSSSECLLENDYSLESINNYSTDLLTFLSYIKFGNNNFSNNKIIFNFVFLVNIFKLKIIETKLNTKISSNENILMRKKLEIDKSMLKAVDLTISKLMELPSLDKSKIEIENFSDNQISEIYNRILARQDIISSYNSVLSFILESLNHPKAKSRMLAIRNLTLLISREPNLLEDQSLRNMIKRRLTESFTSVTDAILDLLYKVLELKNEYIEEYTDIVCNKINDPSITVKRKIVNLIKYMFSHTYSINIKVKLISTLLNELDDEEDRIIDITCYILADVLFLNLGKIMKHDSNNSVSKQTKSYETIYILCGLFEMGATTWNLFERFFEEKIIYYSDFNKAFRNELKESLNMLVESMLELITDFLAGSKIKIEDATSESIMGVMSTFVKYNERLITQDQLITIQPYIINDYKGSNTCFYSLEILNLVLNHQKLLNKSFVQSCKESLMKRLTKFNSKELDRAIQCVWKLFLIDDNTEGVSKACISSLQMILKYIIELQKSIKNFKPDIAIPRLLYLIGGFGRYCNFEKDRHLFISAKLGLIENEPISVFLLKYLLKFCDSSIEKSIRKIGIKNALNICISHPKLFFSVPVAKLIESTFKKKDIVISNIVIGSFLTFLEDEEIKMIKRNGLEVKRSSSIKLDVAVFHGYTLDYVNDGLCSTLVQKYMSDILHICLEKNPENSMNSINFLKMVIKFGFCNPKLCFPTVVSLECAKSNHIRHIGLQLHRFLFEKFETLIETTYTEAIKNTVKYVEDVYQPSELSSCSSFLRMFFRIVKERNSKQRDERFLQSVLRLLGNCKFYKLQKMSRAELFTAQIQVIFLCININEIEFSSQHELLLIITYIEKLILSEEGILTDQYNVLLDLFDDDDDNNDTEKLRYLSLAKILLSFNCLIKCLVTNYSISPDLILRYQETTDKKEFRVHITVTQNNRFFCGEIKNLLTGNTKNQLTLLYNKIEEFVKN